MVPPQVLLREETARGRMPAGQGEEDREAIEDVESGEPVFPHFADCVVRERAIEGWGGVKGQALLSLFYSVL